MAFLKTLSEAVNTMQDLVRTFQDPGKKPFEVQELSSASLASLERLPQVCKDDQLVLYKEAPVYVAVVLLDGKRGGFSLFKMTSEVEATTTFSNVAYKLRPLMQACPRILCRELLQKFIQLLRQHPTWSSAHIAAALGIQEAFRHELVSRFKDEPDEATQILPIMVAIDKQQMDCIQELIICGAKMDLADSLGNNVFHYAAKYPTPKPIQFICGKNQAAVNQLNLEGESALHVACEHNLPDNVESLLRWGANPNLSMTHYFPIHSAVKADAVMCVEKLCYYAREQVHLQDKKYGGTPMHWAKSKQCIYKLSDLGGNLDALSSTGDPPLHIMLDKHRRACVIALLNKGADTYLGSGLCTNALHLAIEKDDVELVKTLIVFGSDVEYLNSKGQTPRHVAATIKQENSDKIVYLLHGVGARRCKQRQAICSEGCAPDGKNDGEHFVSTVTSPAHQSKFADGMVSVEAMAAAMTRSASATSSSIVAGEAEEDVAKAMGKAGERVLSLDGGGIRGLILIQLLMAIEKAAGQPLNTLFDWIAGTSTGGILALGLIHGKSVRYMQGMYFRMKDEVFQGSRPYDSRPLDELLRKEFGETIRMIDKEYPKVMVSAVLGDRNPTELFFFRNYYPPGKDLDKIYKPDARFDPTPKPHEQFVWQAARSSGAAPSYFRSHGRYLDGGLMANNPTLDLLTEIHEYNLGMAAQGQGSETRPLHVVVSLGTGRMPVEHIEHSDIFKPQGLLDVGKLVVGAKNLGFMLIEAATQSEGRPVERSRAWCHSMQVPLFRFSPSLSEKVALDCSEDDKLIQMLWETQCYIANHWDRFKQLVDLLK